MIRDNDPSSQQNSSSSDEDYTPVSNLSLALSSAPHTSYSIAPTSPTLSSAAATTKNTSSNVSTVAATATATTMTVSAGSTSVSSWVSSLSDSVLKTDMTAMNGNVTEAGLAKMMTDLGNE